MKILSIDTAGKFLCIGLSDGKKRYEFNLEAAKKLSGLITHSIGRVIEAAGLEAGALDYLACGLGPGSFTGIRIGMAAVKGLAWALNKPVIGIPSLDTLALNADIEGPVVTAVDAKRGLIYSCIYHKKGNSLRKNSPYMLIGINDLIKKAPKGSTILGDALGLYQEEMVNGIKGARILDKDHWFASAGNILTLAEEKIRERKKTDCFKIEPIYLYPKDCQVRK